MSIDIEYSIYFANPDTAERHHLSKNWRPESVLRDARDVLKIMQRRLGSMYRRHGDWSTRVEVWEIHPGDHGFTIGPDGKEVWEPTAPDRLVAHALWDDDDLTVIDGFPPAGEDNRCSVDDL